MITQLLRFALVPSLGLVAFLSAPLAQGYPTGSQQGPTGSNPAPGITNAHDLTEQQEATVRHALECLCMAAGQVNTAPPGSTPEQQAELKRCKKAMEQACNDTLVDPENPAIGGDSKFPGDFHTADLPPDVHGATTPDSVDSNGAAHYSDDPGNNVYLDSDLFGPDGSFQPPANGSMGPGPTPDMRTGILAILLFHELFRCRQVRDEVGPGWPWERVLGDMDVWYVDYCVAKTILAKIQASAPGYDAAAADTILRRTREGFIGKQRTYELLKNDFPECRRVTYPPV